MIVPWFSGRTLEAQVASWQIVSLVGCGDGEKKGKRKKKETGRGCYTLCFRIHEEEEDPPPEE